MVFRCGLTARPRGGEKNTAARSHMMKGRGKLPLCLASAILLGFSLVVDAEDEFAQSTS